MLSRENNNNAPISNFYLTALHEAAMLLQQKLTIEEVLQWVPTNQTADFNQTNKQLHNIASNYGYQCVDVAPDGNCFYSATAVQLSAVLSLDLSQDEIVNLAHHLRKLAFDHMKEHSHIYSQFAENTFFLEDQKRDKVWVEYILMVALCYALHVNLRILHNDMALSWIVIPDAVCNLFLGYQVGLHYQSLKPLKDGASINQQSKLNDMFKAQEGFSQLEIPFSIHTEEELKTKIQSLLMKTDVQPEKIHEKQKVVDHSVKVIKIEDVVRNNLINFLIETSKDHIELDVKDNADLYNFIKLLITKEEKIAAHGLRQVISAHKRQYEIHLFEFFEAWQNSILLAEVKSGLQEIKVSTIIETRKWQEKQNTKLDTNNIKQIIEKKVQTLGQQFEETVKDQSRKNLQTENANPILFYQGKKYLLKSDTHGNVRIVSDKRNRMITSFDGKKLCFTEKYNTAENYNGSLSFLDANTMSQQLNEFIHDSEKRKILAIDIKAKLMKFSETSDMLNSHDKFSARHLLKEGWKDLYKEFLLHKENKNKLLIKMGPLSDMEEAYDFSNHADTSDDSNKEEKIRFNKPSDTVNEEFSKNLKKLEDLLKEVEQKMLEYCASPAMVRQYIKEYEANPYFSLGVNTARLCAEAQNKSLYIIKDNIVSNCFLNHGNSDIKINEPVYLEFHDDFSFVELKSLDDESQKSEDIASAFFKASRENFINLINQKLQNIEISLEDLSEYENLLDKQIEEISSACQIALGKYTQLKKAMENSGKDLQKLEDIRRIKRECFDKLTSAGKKKLHDANMWRDIFPDTELYDRLENIALIPGNIHDAYGDTLLHLFVRAQKNEYDNIIDLLLDNRTDVYAENKKWFGPGIFIFDKKPSQQICKKYKNTYLIWCNAEKKLHSLYYVDNDGSTHELLLYQKILLKLNEQLG